MHKEHCSIYRLLEIRNVRYENLGMKFYCPLYGELNEEERKWCSGCDYIPPYYKDLKYWIAEVK